MKNYITVQSSRGFSRFVLDTFIYTLVISLIGLIPFSGSAQEHSPLQQSLNKPSSQVQPQAQLPSVEVVTQKVSLNKEENVELEKPSLQLAIINELMGYIEPCGCTIDLKLGSIQRLDALIQKQKSKTTTAVFTVGSHLFDHHELKTHSLAQEQAKAKLLRSILMSWSVDAHLDGELDLAAGESFYKNLKQDFPLPDLEDQPSFSNIPRSHKVIRKEILGSAIEIKLGVVALGESLNEEQQDLVLKAAEQEFHLQQTQINIVLSTLNRSRLRQLAQAYPDIKLWILGYKAQEEKSLSPVELTNNQGVSYIVEAGDRGRHLALIKLYGIEKEGQWTEALGQRQRELKTLELKLKMKQKFAGFSRSPMVQKGIDTLKQQIELLKKAPLPKPEKRIEFELIPITSHLPESLTVAHQVKEYQSSLAELNMKTASVVKPLPPNGNGYAGNAECALCHPEADTFWKTTKHAQAWHTLEEANKTFDVECVSCHVTGWQKPGGSALGHTDRLKDVQCEACHGPAGKHAEIGGGESYVKLKVPSKQCETCHNHLHSPKFDYESYKAKVLGPGHGQPLQGNK